MSVDQSKDDLRSSLTHESAMISTSVNDSVKEVVSHGHSVHQQGEVLASESGEYEGNHTIT